MLEVKATVLENIPIAENICSLTFALPEEVAVLPGQFAMIGVAGFPLRRPIAVCKAEGERITVCYRINGKGTAALAAGYKPGHSLSVLLPLGNGFSLRPEQKRVAVVGGGVGIFPLIAAIRAFSKEHEIHAFMGFRDRAAICMRYDMQRGKSLTVATDDGSEGYHGTAVQAFMEKIGEVDPQAVLACGPVPMLRALASALSGRDLPVQVSLEERMGCGIGACLVCVCDKKDGTHARVCSDGPVFELSEIAL